MATVPITIVNRFLSLPIKAVENIGEFLNSPVHIAKIREVSKSFNSMLTENTEVNRIFWKQHTIDRWGHKYVQGRTQDIISLYAQLHLLEKAALQHLILENEAQIHLFDYNEYICFGIAQIATEYFKGITMNPAWRYHLGINTLCTNFENALFHLIVSANKGYKKYEDRFALALKWLSKASKINGNDAKEILKMIESGELPEKEIWKAAFKFHIDKSSRMSLSQDSESKNKAQSSIETAAKAQHINPMQFPEEIVRHIVSFLAPKQLATSRAVSQYFNTMILENTESNKLLWDAHCVKRWGINYISASAKEKYISVRDKIALYVKLYQLEKAAWRHMTLLDQAFWNDKFSNFQKEEHVYITIYDISERYLQGACPKIGWQYLYGKNGVEIDGGKYKDLIYLEKAAEQGYKDAAAYLGKRLLSNSPTEGVNWLLKADEQNHPLSKRIPDPKALLQAIQNDMWLNYDELKELSASAQDLCQVALRRGLKRKNEDNSQENEPPAKKPKKEITKL